MLKCTQGWHLLESLEDFQCMQTTSNSYAPENFRVYPLAVRQFDDGHNQVFTKGGKVWQLLQYHYTGPSCQKSPSVQNNYVVI